MVRIAATRGQVELQPGDGEEADRGDHVVDQGQQGGQAELPLEAEPDVERDGAQGENRRDQGGFLELAADLGAHELGAAVVDDGIGEGFLD